MSEQLKPLVDEIRDVLAARKTPGYDEMAPLAKARVIVPEIAEAACVALQGLDPAKQQEMVPQYVEAAETLFDEQFVPIDLPGVGLVAELALEGFLRRMIGPAIEAAAKRLAA